MDREAICLLSKSILVKLRTEIGAKKITFGLSVKLGVIIEYTPPKADAPTFQVHVCFCAKEVYDDMALGEVDGTIDPSALPDYGDAFLSKVIYTDYESFPRVHATQKEVIDYLGTDSMSDAQNLIFKKGSYSTRCSEFALSQDENEDENDQEKEISFGYFETIINMQTFSPVWKATIQMTGMHPLLAYRQEVRRLFSEKSAEEKQKSTGERRWDYAKYAYGEDGFTESDNLIDIPPPPQGLMMLGGQIFKSYGQGSTQLYKGFQPQMKLVDESMGGQEIFSTEGYVEADFERELMIATHEQKQDHKQEPYENITKKLLLLGEMDMRPSATRNQVLEIYDEKKMQYLDPDYLEVIKGYPNPNPNPNPNPILRSSKAILSKNAPVNAAPSPNLSMSMDVTVRPTLVN